MTFDELRSKNNERQLVWPGNSEATMEFRAIEFGGESGELLDAIKKFIRGRDGIHGNIQEIEDIEEEMGDVLITLDLLANELGVDLDQAWRRKFNRTSYKYNIDCFVDEPEAEVDETPDSGIFTDVQNIVDTAFFMRNTRALRLKIQTDIERYLGFPNEYAVVCDDINNSPAVVSANRFVVDLCLPNGNTVRFNTRNLTEDRSDTTPNDPLGVSFPDGPFYSMSQEYDPQSETITYMFPRIATTDFAGYLQIMGTADAPNGTIRVLLKDAETSVLTPLIVIFHGSHSLEIKAPLPVTGVRHLIIQITGDATVSGIRQAVIAK